MFATLDFCKSLIIYHAEKNKDVIYRFGLGPFLRPQQNIFPVRTSHPVNNIYTGCPQKNKTIENDVLLEFQCLALN